MIIAIDGYSSCGKSTFAKSIASKLGYSFIDTGAMYRAVTLYAIQHNMVHDPSLIIESLDSINIEFIYDPQLERSRIYLNNVDVDEDIRHPEVTANVSAVSAIAQVRSRMVTMQQNMGHNGNIVMDGRDIGTVVFPDADLKIFMTASSDIRAQRRYKELKAKGLDVSLEEIHQSIIERDHQDETRTESPLRRASDAILLDNSHMSVEEQMNWIMKKIDEIKLHKNSSNIQ